jgi:preprotein translocase subunit SecF
LLTGAYSSIFVATPLLAWLKEREPRYRALRARAQADLGRHAARAATAPDTPVPVPTAAGGATAAAVAEPALVGDGTPDGAVDDVADAPPLLGASPESEPEPGVEATAPAEPAPPRPAAPAAPTARPPTSTSGTRGTANPRPRQQRGKKRR